MKNLYRNGVSLHQPLCHDLAPLEILFNRFKDRGIIAGKVLLMPDSEEYLPLAAQAEALGIKISRFSASQVQEKPLMLQQQRWNLEDDSGNDTWLGAPMAQVVAENGWQTVLLLPLANMLIETEAVFDSLALHRRESFDLTAAEERICGAAWCIFEADLLVGLMKSHPDLMWARGGLAWAVRKPLYPFKVGAYHCPRVRPSVTADLRLNSQRAAQTLSAACSDNFALPSFSYEKWLTESGWETIWCDFAPLIVNVEPANICNGSCYGCVYPQMQRPPVMMTPDIFSRLAGSFKHGDDCRWVFSGMGEPLLNPFIADMASAVAGYSSMLITSLQKLPEEDFPFASFDQIRISTDALAEEEFFRKRPGCSWKNIENFLNFARVRKRQAPEKFPEIGVSFLRHALSELQMQPFLNYWKQVVKPVFRDNFFRWPFDTVPEAIQWYQILGEAVFTGARSRSSKVDFTPVRRRPCRNATLSLTVLSDGRVTICPYDYEGRHVLGDVKVSSLKDIWHSEAARAFRHRHLQMQLSEDSACSACIDWYHPV